MKRAMLPGLIMAILLPLLCLADGVKAQERPLLETVGISQIVAEPDLAEVVVEVRVKADDAVTAKQQADKAVNAFIKRLLEAGVDKDKIASANLHLQPQYHYPANEEPKLTGYQANRTVTLQVALEQLNPVLDKALQNGINSVSQIMLKSSKEAELRLKARDAAIADARQKAKALAAGFDAKLDGVWSIRYYDQSPAPMLGVSRKAMLEAADSNQGYQYGKVEFSDRVEVSYKLKD